MAERAIGGVFAAPHSGPRMAGSLWDNWTADAQSVLTFRNARSAFAHLLRHIAPLRVWLPAYCCTDLAQAVVACALPLQFYHSDAALTPDAVALEAKLRPGDLVLGINPFGRPAEALRPLAARLPDIIWVEDCAQSADTAAPHWAPLRLFSPRKLLGVPDGGLLVDALGHLPAPAQCPAASATLRHAGLLRQRDTNDQDNIRWYAAFRRAEDHMQVSDHAMSALTAETLRATSAEPVSAARRRNYTHLHRALTPRALWPDPAPGWVPLGFPLRTPDASAVSAALAKQRIFAPRHWRTLAADTPNAAEQTLARTLLTLPCDQRYDAADMDRIIHAIRPLLT